jgi:hypothetical protein
MPSHHFIPNELGASAALVVPILALSFSSLAAADIANLVQDGSFETPQVASGSYSTLAGGSTAGSWAVRGTEVALVSTSFTGGGFTYQAQSGSQWMDLSGALNPNPTNSVFQTIATQVGTEYELTFYIGSAWTGGQFVLKPIVDVTIGNAPRASFTNPNTATGGQMDWMQFATRFVASNAATEIEFRYGNAADTPNYIVGIDTVSVTVVPAPGSLALVMSLSARLSGRKRRSA